jgi:hypothetical protein
MLPRILSFLFIVVLFIVVIVPVAVVMALLTAVAVFVVFANGTLRNLLEHRERLLSTESLTRTVKEIIKKNTIDV